MEQPSIPAGPGFCPGCGEARVAGKAFCANCGRSFAEAGPPMGPETTAEASPQRLGSMTGADLAIIGGAALLLAAPFFPFLSATAALVGSISRSGVEITSGEALVISAVGAVAGFVALRSFGRPKGRAPLLLGLVGLGLSVYYYLQVDERVQSIDSEVGFASIGAGIWMALAGSGLLVIATLVANRKKD
jgi:hypothetical protein